MLNMLYYKLFFIFCVLIVLPSINGFGAAPPLLPVVCSTLDPIGHMAFPSEGTEDLDFAINTNKDWFLPNETITITVSSPSLKTFKGLLLQVRDCHKSPCGRLSFTQTDYQHFRCEYVLQKASLHSSVSHNNNEEKSEATFFWTAPPSCEEREYKVSATIVKSRRPNSYQTGLRKLLECRPHSYSTMGSLETAFDHESTRRQTQCRFDDLTSIPRGKYRTSFENEDLNGWNNTGWIVNSGKTGSEDTGPIAAADGEKYLYFETSYLPTIRSMAELNTDQDLRGCFCVKLQHNHNVDAKKRHELKITAGSETLYRVKNKQPYWQHLSLQVDTDTFVKVKITGYRGSNNRGDMAIDDVQITEGLCSQEEL